MRFFSFIGYLSIFLFLQSREATLEEMLGSLQMPKEIEASEIEDKPGAELPLDVTLIDQDGRLVVLGDYFKDDKRPVILNLLYLGCPMLCSVVQKGLVDGLKKLSFKAGQDFRVISVSIDHREKSLLAKKKQATFLSALDLSDETSWTVHVATEKEVKRLADAVGFNYIFDRKTDQFAHGAGVFVVSSPNGRLSRTLFGVEFKPSDLKLALSEAAEGKIGSFVDRVLLSCFHYDPDSHRYGVYVFGVMRLGGIVTILTLGLVLLMYFRAERKSIKLG